MTNIDESTTNDPDNEEQNQVETPTHSDYFDEQEKKENISIYPDEEKSDLENRFLEILSQHLHVSVQGEKYLSLKKEGGLNYRQGELEE